MYIKLDDLSPSQVYHQMIQTLVPRPIAWALSENRDGSLNLAPFSYFTAVCSDPPLLMLSIGRRPDGASKDTLENIEQRRHFVVHIAHSGLLEPLNASAASLPAGTSEVERLELPTTTFEGFALPRLAQCRIAYACECHQVQEIGNQRQALVFGHIHTLYVDEGITRRDEKGRIKVDAEKLDPLGRLGANEYLCRGKVVRADRPA
jgi:flavin reductase (DIM6/NTAB) family NADH-FMN oxidoreductase RutF